MNAVKKVPRARALCCLVAGVAFIAAAQPQPPPAFGGAYANLDARRQTLIQDWVARFAKTTGQALPPDRLYDELITLSTKTTFEAVTHALMTTALTDTSGASLGDALGLVERVEAVRGEVEDAPGDRQFRLYVRLVPEALNTLARSTQFKRGADNSVFHKGYPTNYREQKAVPSVQISIALDGRRADVDVDYRSSGFPVALFNGHLTASNSDVRAGNNYDRHLNRWSGFQNWWRGFFGTRQARLPDDATPATTLLPATPRIGKVNIDVAARDFLNAWLVEGDIVAAMGSISARSHACVALHGEDPSNFDRGQAPFQLMIDMKAAHDSLGSPRSLDGLIVGTRLTNPGLRVVSQPYHAQFVLYSVPDDVAATFDCENQLLLGDRKRANRAYGTYFGATFYVNGRNDFPLRLLWAREDGYWKVVSWHVGSTADASPDAAPVPSPAPARINAEPTLVQAAHGFLESWLVRKDYDAAFAYLAPAAYQCYELEGGAGEPRPANSEEAARRLRAGLETAGKLIGTSKRLEDVLTAAEPVHPATRVMDHRHARIFSLASPPNALADAAECAARSAGAPIPDPMPLEYGAGYAMTMKFKTQGGGAPVMRLLWRQQNGAWRITAYGVELP